ncbi:MAG: DUF551 domain-containing protein [Flavobacteriales bacterium]|nr:DUF551 domain-containing protein [Flavobacteriales bacterium]
MSWIAVTDKLPTDKQRVLAFVPGNKVFLPGKSGEFEIREVLVLHFQENFYAAGTEKHEKFGPHFWQGEGNSNHYCRDVTHWMPIPGGPSY